MTKEVCLTDLLTFTRDGEWGKGEATEGYSCALVIRGTDFERVRAGNLTTLPLRYIRTDILTRKKIVAGDTLIETAGGTKDQPTGRSVFIQESVVSSVELPLICASFARFLRPNSNRVDPQFLFWKLQDEYNSRRMMPYHVQHTGVARFQYTQFAENYPFSLPPLPEQRAIAATLGALDDKIELNRKINATLESMARTLFRDWFVDFGPTRAKMAGAEPYLSPELWALFPERLDDEGKPEGWEIGTLGTIATAKSEGVDPSAISPTTPYIGLEHMPRGSIALSNWEAAAKVSSNKAAFAVGDFLFGKLRPYFHKVGVAPVSGICSTDIVVVRQKTASWAGFTIACISDDNFIAYTNQTSTGTKMPRTSWSIMAKYPVTLPCSALAEAFNAALFPILERIRTNIHESRTLAQTRDLLLPRLMSGELRVAEAAQIASEVA